jgi:sulfopyruvate decarboxylase TPP-binding subunit
MIRGAARRIDQLRENFGHHTYGEDPAMMTQSDGTTASTSVLAPLNSLLSYPRTFRSCFR